MSRLAQSEDFRWLLVVWCRATGFVRAIIHGGVREGGGEQGLYVRKCGWVVVCLSVGVRRMPSGG